MGVVIHIGTSGESGKVSPFQIYCFKDFETIGIADDREES